MPVVDYKFDDPMFSILNDLFQKWQFRNSYESGIALAHHLNTSIKKSRDFREKINAKKIAYSLTKDDLILIKKQETDKEKEQLLSLMMANRDLAMTEITYQDLHELTPVIIQLIKDNAEQGGL